MQEEVRDQGVCLSLGMAYWSAIQPELVVEHTGVGVVVTQTKTRSPGW